MRRIRALVTIIVTFGLATLAFSGVAGAGGELSKSEYLDEANAICADQNEQIDAALEEVFADVGEEESLTPEQQQAFLDAILPLVRQALDDVEALNGPNKLEKKVDKLVDDYRELLDEVEDDPSLLFESEDDPFASLDKRSAKLGLTECAGEGEEEE